MPRFIDQMGNVVTLDGLPERIVSLVPSQSEFLWDLGLREELAGVTKFCVHPPGLSKTRERVGGTKKLDLEKIRRLKPDLVIGNKEENQKEQVEALQREFNVWMSDITTLRDSYAMMRSLGEILGRSERAEQIVKDLQERLDAIRNFYTGQTVAYFIWNQPYMLAGNDTFIDHILRHIGLTNVAAGLSRYPEVSADDLIRLNPETCFLSSEPFPFKESHAAELRKILPRTKVHIVDGEVFSWYGTRLFHLPAYVQGLKM